MVPLARPVMAPLSCVPSMVARTSPGVDWMIQLLMGLPPVETGGVHASVALPSPAVAVPMVGGPGGLMLLPPQETATAAAKSRRVMRIRMPPGDRPVYDESPSTAKPQDVSAHRE